ncbi:MAG: peptidoglycan recognition family protein, partial [Oscillospiraceae bacterium]
IYRGRPENMRGGHTTNWNYCSIGICFEGNFEAENMSDAQLTAGQELVADIVSRYPSIIIGRHSEFGQTSCPGKNFPFEFVVHPTDEGTAEDKPTEPSAWAAAGCDWAKSIGLFVGNGDGDFMWHEPMTREMLAVILERFAKRYGLK